jgi:hypothetical protein
MFVLAYKVTWQQKSKKIDFRAEINFLICGGAFDCGDSTGFESLSGDERNNRFWVR